MYVERERYQYLAAILVAVAGLLYGNQTAAFATDRDIRDRVLIAAGCTIEFKRPGCVPGNKADRVDISVSILRDEQPRRTGDFHGYRLLLNIGQDDQEPYGASPTIEVETRNGLVHLSVFAW